MDMKKASNKSEFGKRVARLRKAKGLTQAQLGELVGVSNQLIAYYEKETRYPPSRLIVPLAKALGISADELLGIKEAKTEFNPAKAALWRKLKVVENLPQIDPKAILHYIKTAANNRQADQKAAKKRMEVLA
jgi:transcriptional regulator with XRE-family HTH domain